MISPTTENLARLPMLAMSSRVFREITRSCGKSHPMKPFPRRGEKKCIYKLSDNQNKSTKNIKQIKL